MYSPTQLTETKVAILEEKLNSSDQLLAKIENAIDKLIEANANVTRMLAVHDEKLDKQDKIDAVLFEKIDSLHRDLTRQTDAIKKGCEGDIMKVNARLTDLEKKMWTMAGGLAIVSLIFSAFGNKIITNVLTPATAPAMIHRSN
jgi:arsenate reductase-like glutaredoxin family protein